ncbi:hypothetical protein Tco_1486843 [Tanacetum coccineum]
MTSVPKCRVLHDAVGGWDLPRMMVLYCQNSVEDDRVDAAAKTAEFLNEYLWKDDKWMRKLRNMEMDANLLAFENDHFIEKL